jgi:phenylalanyl-tRNA synthetase alpha chain
VGISRDSQWVEIAEGGLAHAGVLARAGLDSSYSGLALGMGLDRLLMLLKAIPDIRVLRATDPAIASQMTDLSPYRPVSAMPPIRRDLSLVVDGDDLVEDLGDRVRDALGDDAACVESVDILQQTPCSALPAPALGRLGAHRDQKNLLIRVVLRHFDKTLSNHEANVVRDRIYAALHQGTTEQWATTPAPT